MRFTVIALAAVILGGSAAEVFALEPAQAGEEARASLDALERQQRDEATDAAKPVGETGTPSLKGVGPGRDESDRQARSDDLQRMLKISESQVLLA